VLPVPANPGPPVVLSSPSGEEPLFAVPSADAGFVTEVRFERTRGALERVATVSTGGQGPVAAVGGDFNHDGLSDLLVANNGSGTVGVLLGTPDGLSLFTTLSLPDGLNPTDLALSQVSENTLYVSVEGLEEAFALTLPFAEELPPGSGSGGGILGSIDLQPQTNADLAVVATLLGSAGETTEVVETEESSRLAALSVSLFAGTVRTTAITVAANSGESAELGPDPEESEGGDTLLVEPEDWLRFLPPPIDRPEMTPRNIGAAPAPAESAALPLVAAWDEGPKGAAPSARGTAAPGHIAVAAPAHGSGEPAPDVGAATANELHLADAEETGTVATPDSTPTTRLAAAAALSWPHLLLGASLSFVFWCEPQRSQQPRVVIRGGSNKRPGQQ
jgi:hypothetical protein